MGRESRFFAEGFEAFHRGEDGDANPYADGTGPNIEWHRGFRSALSDFIDEMNRDAA